MTLPKWVKAPLKDISKTQRYFKNRKINTVCETLRCPNRGKCYRDSHATFMILGNVCTRFCSFCNSERGIPEPVDPSEPERIASVVKEMEIKYVIVTSPTRDDLEDGGAQHYFRTVEAIRNLSPQSLVEVLVPDFNGNRESVRKVINSGIVVFSHNIEVVRRFYGTVRDGDYKLSLEILKLAKEIEPNIITKSGFMVGFGERFEEIEQTLRDLKESYCDIVTVGQYLQPSKKALPVVEYINPELFEEIEKMAKEIGFRVVSAAPLVRSSTDAFNLYTKAKEA